ncbi:hypothetical protein IVB34_01765 [Bradyrhizobium sp. 2]|uniref:hypothetical protein n=1 Tax=Bradyrhizobium sp. 2 TaxID=190045 RepID=UPI001FFB2BA5|nr:hypothetical protein [Bradyrhizobium sp. 2]MCK1457116.1 hypothetical protein [Bradyrhizobium sp. 2]
MASFTIATFMSLRSRPEKLCGLDAHNDMPTIVPEHSYKTGHVTGLTLTAVGPGFIRLNADSDDLARVFRFDLAQDSEMISPTIPI